MKKSKLKKLIENSIKNTMDHYLSPKKGVQPELEDNSEYDPEVSDKFKKLVYNILNYSTNLNINISSDLISISCDSVKRIKNSQNNNMKVNTDEDYLEIAIRKSGFSISRGYRLRSNYKDYNMYDDLISDVKDRLKKRNSDAFNSIYSDIMKDSGLIRDTNLDDILEDII